MEHTDQLLSTIKRLNVSPYLFNRIEQQFENQQFNLVSTRNLAWVGLALLLFFYIDTMALKHNPMPHLAESYSAQFTPDNQLYP